ncbi:hypothetical protein K469DRAFT_728400 [Zopfia rhizophila CBS 207.26]|uniref:Peptidase M43 pregnancy-associated plasma-A domain-containing protein n=1 Tax=Zopfia rhizophila CBS 207.26 TaxID=1314779 RepID=A0A6A6DWQ8_9PEZI|nr:hypothetical protein K469DRAFT_728400 [Zopfia rhizophila CBS 207.26]
MQNRLHTDTSHASKDLLNTISSLHGNQNSGSPAARAAALATRDKDNNSAIAVEVVFHITTKQGKEDDINSNMPQAQMDVLNQLVTWTVNDAWAVGKGSSDLEMKKALRQGTYSMLNIYFQTELSGGVFGQCTLPSSVGNGNGNPSVYANDGCNVNVNTMSEGSMDGYNKGKTAVHEAGHWLGLLYTFEGYSCDGPGDNIEDTPQESQSTEGCPTFPSKRSCPDLSSGLEDPIYNYMDYSIDSCYTGFTPRQHDRMHYMFNMFRDGR